MKTNPENKKISLIICFTIICLLFFTTVFYFIYILQQNITIEVKEEGSISVCFTNQNDCSQIYLDLIENSSQSKAAVYDINFLPIKESLTKKSSDVIVFDESYDGFGKPVRSKGLMHNKFYLIYNYSGKDYIITGSTNPTHNDLFKNDNNVIIISSRTIFGNYEEQFEEIKYGKEKSNTKKKLVNLSGVGVENYFCPEDECEKEVLSEISDAKKSIFFMVFSFTSDTLGDEIIRKNQQVEIKGIFDKSQIASNKEHSEYYALNEHGIELKINTGPGKLHHKVFIIDNETVITGSYNPTSSGTSRNDENIIIVHDKRVAKKYLEEFERIWMQAS